MNVRAAAVAVRQAGASPTEGEPQVVDPAAAWRIGSRHGEVAEVHYAVRDTSLGTVLVARSPRGLNAVFLGDDPRTLEVELRRRFPEAAPLDGSTEMDALADAVVACVDSPEVGLHAPLDPGGTEFQQAVWEVLRAIPPGETASYAQIAARIGRPRSVRAVGQACAANALAIVIPCHRAVGSDGRMTGYRWGVERKRRLLEMEARRG
jgi:AraC family transcriptional regulator of adaptative response/methylated-DNA-[protein]-cysteine methyltransferase